MVRKSISDSNIYYPSLRLTKGIGVDFFSVHAETTRNKVVKRKQTYVYFNWVVGM